MNITIQFPIADARPFLKRDVPRLSQVNLTNSYRFVRYFGKVKKRIKNNSLPKELATDGYYTSAKCALIVPDLGKYYGGHQKEQVYDSPTILLKPSYLSRRLFTDGRCAIARVEMGLNFDGTNLDGKQSLSVIKDYLTLPTKVPSFHCSGRYKSDDNLQNQGGTLAKLFLYATTPTTNFYNKNFDTAPIMGCSPILFFEYDEFDPYGKPLNQSILPEKVQRIDKEITNNINLSYYTFINKENSIGVWFIGCDNKNKESVKLLKNCLLKLHAEQEVLKNIVLFITNKINNNQNDIAYDELNDYIYYSTKIIFKNKRSGIFQKSIFDAVNQCESLVNNIDLVTIENAISNLDRIISSKRSKEKVHTIFNNIIKILESLGDRVTHNITVIGDGNYIVNQSIVKNAFNKVKNEYGEEAAKALLRISEEINRSGKKEAVENFEAFSNELSKPEPKKSLLKSLWQGTLDALPSLKELVDVVASVVLLFT